MDRFALSAVGGVVERAEDVARGTGPAATPSPPDSRARAWASPAPLVLFAAAHARVSPARRKCGGCARRRGVESGAGTGPAQRVRYPGRGRTSPSAPTSRARRAGGPAVTARPPDSRAREKGASPALMSFAG
jgi:hypothetical protein